MHKSSNWEHIKLITLQARVLLSPTSLFTSCDSYVRFARLRYALRFLPNSGVGDQLRHTSSSSDYWMMHIRTATFG